ncbi:HR-like lesion-inducing protein-like protein [Rhynchospora pubera]|uniref:HR-like lesion-inducing protein-like protein n=1 Tax=Rhynchospora pubera TaxID=906938 RepID=A0AAV8ESD7_9POAL|nr:HR-like lesion-inducing protein-like protein [Rhynchospora pubera]
MSFVSFAGRVLFASVFLLSAYQEFNEFGTDGGPAAKALKPKFNILTKHINSHLGVALPPIDMKHVIMATIALKGLGGLLFILSSTVGAYLLVCFSRLLLSLSHSFFFSLEENTTFISLLSDYMWYFTLFLLTPVVYDFYNYDSDRNEFVQLFIKFNQNLALFGALLFFIGMKNSIPKRASKKKGPKSKTN